MARGFTLLETLVVMFILGIIASVALPDLSGSNSYKLDRAAEELAMGLRYARDESVRTGEPHAFDLIRPGTAVENKRVRIYKLNMADPAQFDSSFLLYHPISKHPFEYNFYDQMDGVIINSQLQNFSYDNPGSGFYNDERIFFDKEGKPFIYDNSFSPKYRVYESGHLRVEYNDQEKIIKVEAGGWVVIQ